MDKPIDPATPFAEVYQSFFDDLALDGTKPTNRPGAIAHARLSFPGLIGAHYPTRRGRHGATQFPPARRPNTVAIPSR